MSDYDTLRHLADSWGLVAMGVLFVGFVGWALRPAARPRHAEAATMIFNDEEQGR
ncbi:MAG: cbb3-type cytochrome c oxidase subunit 3 [Sphingomonadales bacterium]|jgi:cytochrome c oxidase cbb3-type subunit 4